MKAASVIFCPQKITKKQFIKKFNFLRAVPVECEDNSGNQRPATDSSNRFSFDGNGTARPTLVQHGIFLSSGELVTPSHSSAAVKCTVTSPSEKVKVSSLPSLLQVRSCIPASKYFCVYVCMRITGNIISFSEARLRLKQHLHELAGSELLGFSKWSNL